MSKQRTILALAVMFVGGFFVVTSISSLNYQNIAIGIAIAVGAFVYLGRGLSRRQGSKSFVAIDFIAVVLIAVFFLTMILGALSGLIGNDQPTQNVTQFLLIFAFGGIIMAFISGVLKFSTSITVPQFNTALIYIAANFASFFLLNLLVPPASYRVLGLAITPSSPFITVMISIPEELVFHIWLAPWLANISRTGVLGGSFMSAVIATAYHLFVLQTAPAKLGIVFGAMFVSAFTAIKAKLASVTITSHFLNNLISVFGPH